MSKFDSLMILGPTASGKTKLAAQVTHALSGCLISADSRQFYKGMDIGTGKDLEDLVVCGKSIPFEMIDICPAGERFNIQDYYQGVSTCLNQLQLKEQVPVVCGGSGLYLECFLRNHSFSQIPKNNALRLELAKWTTKALESQFTQIEEHLRIRLEGVSRKRLIRALEIDSYLKQNEIIEQKPLLKTPLIIGIQIERTKRRQNIYKRLESRIEEGLINEVEQLMAQGLSDEQLIYYGLEYKWVVEYLRGDFNFERLKEGLFTAICQFAKRQMTWFRRMERQGFDIQWLPSTLTEESKLEWVLQKWKN